MYGNKMHMLSLKGYTWMRYLCMQTHKTARQDLIISSFEGGQFNSKILIAFLPIYQDVLMY